MPFSDALVRLEAAVFDRLGEDASWSGITGTVRVRRREADEEIGFGHGFAIVDGARIKVRKSEVPAPIEGDQVQVLDSNGTPLEDGGFIVAGEPRLDRKGVWTCPVKAA